MRIKNVFFPVGIMMIGLFFLSSCSKPTPIEVVETSSPQTEEPIATQPGTASTENPSLPSMTEDPNALSPEPQAVEITSTDGKVLNGYYYPSAKNPAPLVVLMHWMGGSMADWYEIAPWLQNRGLDNPFPVPGSSANYPWWDPSWFPPVSADKSYAVLIFTFRDCDLGGCNSMDDAGRLMDAQSVMSYAYTLEGIDQSRIVAIGSSIGADGAVDGCQYLNEQHPGSCQGGLSLSPGDYLGVSYTETIRKMGKFNPPVAAWCLADENEYSVCSSAEEAGNSAFKDFKIEGGQHGNMLLRPNLDPLPMQLILDFLAETLG